MDDQAPGNGQPSPSEGTPGAGNGKWLYFNEIDPFAVKWLQRLYQDAWVDERSIVNVLPADLVGYRRHHFFAGISGWEYALSLAGWPDDRPVWTGSCPCQPFSSAGKGKGEEDERHLWPAFRRLVAECRPAALFGEQVSSKLGIEWLAGVRTDLETLGYAVGAADLPAACVGAPHRRQRLFWVAHRQEQRQSQRLADGGGGDEGIRAEGGGSRPADHCGPGGVGYASLQRWNAGADNGNAAERSEESPGTGGAPGFWNAFDTVYCRDGNARRVEPGSQPLAHGVPARVGRLRGYGNAIVPQVAAVFIWSFLEAEACL
jgi:DNA (cytosine-5)-methyltransferase 1